VNGILHPAANNQTPETINDIPSCDVLANYFANKVRDTLTAIATKLQSLVNKPADDIVYDGPGLDMLSHVTVHEVQKVISSMPSKTSPLDILPTDILKSCSEFISPVIATLANLSFQSGTFPAKFKIAQVKPLLKKQGLDQQNPSNYRPISNLNTVSMILE
jgi:hypothetical protein